MDSQPPSAQFYRELGTWLKILADYALAQAAQMDAGATAVAESAAAKADAYEASAQTAFNPAERPPEQPGPAHWLEIFRSGPPDHWLRMVQTGEMNGWTSSQDITPPDAGPPTPPGRPGIDDSQTGAAGDGGPRLSPAPASGRRSQAVDSTLPMTARGMTAPQAASRSAGDPPGEDPAQPEGQPRQLMQSKTTRLKLPTRGELRQADQERLPGEGPVQQRQAEDQTLVRRKASPIRESPTSATEPGGSLEMVSPGQPPEPAAAAAMRVTGLRLQPAQSAVGELEVAAREMAQPAGQDAEKSAARGRLSLAETVAPPSRASAEWAAPEMVSDHPESTERSAPEPFPQAPPRRVEPVVVIHPPAARVEADTPADVPGAILEPPTSTIEPPLRAPVYPPRPVSQAQPPNWPDSPRGRWPDLPRRNPPAESGAGKTTEPGRRERLEQEQKGRPWNA